jgi:recombination protein RecR
MPVKYPHALENLVELLKTLPGIGRRSAVRMAFQMLEWDREKLRLFAETTGSLKEKITTCPECGFLSEHGGLCSVCSSGTRNRSVICVVEDAARVFNIESGAIYKGLYHVLGGRLAPLEGQTVDQASSDKLRERAHSEEVREIILALSADVEGQATCAFIAEILKDRDVKVSVPARGLPAGSDISYADTATLAAAFNGRHSM